MENKVQKMLPVITAAGLLLLWELAVKFFQIPLYVLPGPVKVVQAFCLNFGVLVSHSAVTVMEAVLGMAIAVFLGIFLGMIMDGFPMFKSSIYPLLVVTQTVPVIVLAPIFIIYLGFGLAPKILTVVLMCFFPIVVSFTDGMAGINPDYTNLVRSFGSGKWQVYKFVKIPAAMPSFISGLRVAATYSISGAVVGEWISAKKGLGYYMLVLKNGYMLDKVFACVVMIILLSLVMNGLVRLIQYITIPYN